MRVLRTSLPLALLLLAGCGDGGGGGGDGSPPLDKTAPFVGSWVAAGALKFACPTLMVDMTQAISNAGQTITKGTDSDLVVNTFLPGCSVKMNVSGSTATIVPAQMCTLMVMGFQAMGMFSSGQMMVNGDTGTFMYTGTGTFAGSVPCTFSAMGTLVKGTPDGGAPPAADAGTD
jgi:hypothetical protein